MRCRDVEALDSAYLDGELDEARASAVRGHLRVCEACSERVADLATLIAAAARLEPVDPEPSLWAGIERGLAEAEIADSRRSWLWLRWQAMRPGLLPVTVALAAALVVWTARRDHEPRPAPAQTIVAGEHGEPRPGDTIDPRPGDTIEPTPEGMIGDAEPAVAEAFTEAMDRDLAEADQRYVDAIAELLAIVDEERVDWPEDRKAAHDARLRAFDDAVRGHRQVLVAGSAGDARARDALHAVYRAEIAFLQRAALQGPERIAGLDRAPARGGPR